MQNDVWAINVFTGREISAIDEARIDHAHGAGFNPDALLYMVGDVEWVEAYKTHRARLVADGVEPWDGR